MNTYFDQYKLNEQLCKKTTGYIIKCVSVR
jgi:hypothetical protein